MQIQLMNEHKNNLTYGASPKIFENAKALKREMTEAEKILWGELRNSKLCGFKFRRQHPIGKFVADFYCHSKKLVIELDGGIHEQVEIQERDRERTQEMQEFGLTIARFKNEEVEHNLNDVLAALKVLLLKEKDLG